MTDIFGPLESTNGVKGVMVVNFYDDRITSTIFRDQSEAKDLFCKLREVHVLINWYCVHLNNQNSCFCDYWKVLVLKGVRDYTGRLRS